MTKFARVIVGAEATPQWAVEYEGDLRALGIDASGTNDWVELINGNIPTTTLAEAQALDPSTVRWQTPIARERLAIPH